MILLLVGDRQGLKNLKYALRENLNPKFIITKYQKRNSPIPEKQE